MSTFGSNLELIQVYLDGKTRDDIIRLQYFNNQINQTKYNYTAPVQLKNGTYEVWFYADIKEWQDPRDLTDEEKELIRKFGE